MRFRVGDKGDIQVILTFVATRKVWAGKMREKGASKRSEFEPLMSFSKFVIGPRDSMCHRRGIGCLDL